MRQIIADRYWRTMSRPVAAMPSDRRRRARGADRIRAGHPWIYRSDVATSDAEPGDLVRVRRRTRAAAGLGVLEQRVADLAAVRSASTPTCPTSARCCRERLAAARRRTATALGIDATAWRLVHGEADRLPGLDRRSLRRRRRTLVVQTLSQGMDRRLALHRRAARRARSQPRGILARNDPKVRQLEGLDEQVEVLHGEVPERIEVARRARSRYAGRSSATARRPACSSISARTTQAAAPYARGRALDAFTYNGGFALQMAPRVRVGARARLVGGGRRGDARRTRARNGLDERRGRAKRTCSTSCASSRSRGERVRHHRARSAGVREEQGRASSARWPATRKSTCARCKLLDARRPPRSPAVARTTSARRCSRTIVDRPPLDAHATVDARREAHAGARSSGAARRARDALPEVPRAAGNWRRRPVRSGSEGSHRRRIGSSRIEITRTPEPRNRILC